MKKNKFKGTTGGQDMVLWSPSHPLKVIQWLFNYKIHFLVVWTLPLELP